LVGTRDYKIKFGPNEPFGSVGYTD
jgi:hypothetical protein